MLDLSGSPTRRRLLAGATAGLAATLAGCGGTVGRLGSMLGDGGDLDPETPGVASYRVRRGDTLIELARRFGLGYVELAAANPGVDPWKPRRGSRLVVPTARLLPRGPREGVLVNLADMRIYDFGARRGGGALRAGYPIGIGREGHRTPLGTTRVVGKTVAPTWRPPPAVRAEKPELPAVVPPGPDNPLGSHALYLAWPTYLIHGTNIPWSVGRHASNGCVRLYPEHITEFFAAVPVGTPVTVVHEPIKLGRLPDDGGGELYLEAHPSERQADELEETRSFTPEVPKGIMRRLAREAGPNARRIDWAVATRAVLERRGCPVRLTTAAA